MNETQVKQSIEAMLANPARTRDDNRVALENMRDFINEILGEDSRC